MCAGLLVNVEIKNSPRDSDWDPSDRAAELLVELLAAREGRDRVLVSSFNLASIDRVRSLAPDVPTALLTWGKDPLEALLIAESHGHRRAAPRPAVGGRSERAAAAATRAHERGLEVNVWTVNDPAELARLAAAGHRRADHRRPRRRAAGPRPLTGRWVALCEPGYPARGRSLSRRPGGGRAARAARRRPRPTGRRAQSGRRRARWRCRRPCEAAGPTLSGPGLPARQARLAQTCVRVEREASGAARLQHRCERGCVQAERDSQLDCIVRKREARREQEVVHELGQLARSQRAEQAHWIAERRQHRKCRVRRLVRRRRPSRAGGPRRPLPLLR